MPEGNHLQQEAADHGGDAEEPYRSPQQIGDEVQTQAAPIGGGGGGPALGRRGERGETARGQCQ
jgi:hypothetical protein